ncbi:S1C family serine protease [Planococcus glaciei]|uniref:S1C family serine protease n=1 Tax=Planococcus glaciei TaxID=459472 RepID=UPI001C73DD3A|nr:trypsin-like peptidase domain-containing protein [Planococcus glaciei]MBX0313274.1 S1C family serine protease [Planococcus glaciei]
MFCSKCGCMNSVTTKNCLNCGQPLDRTTRIKKHKRRQRLNFFVVAILFLGTGFGSARMFQQPADDQPETAVERAVATEPQANPPLERAATETVTQPQDTQTSSGDGTKAKTDIIKDTQQKVFTIKTDNAYGSGFLFTDTGTIVTSAHLIIGTIDVSVRTTDGVEEPGKVIGISETYDIALIQVDAFAGTEPLEVETNPTEIGTEVIALGSPSGLENTAAIGYLTGIDRDFDHGFLYKDMYQIDAQIAPGSSGGPLIDASTGKVIGINALLLNEGNAIGFSIPMYSMTELLQGWATEPMSENEVEDVYDTY